jgi:hypothetical protein
MAADIQGDRVLMAAALGRVEGGGLTSLVIDDEAGARMPAAIRDDACGGERATGGADVEVGAMITVLGKIREGS